jgi:ribosomal protein S27E
MKRDELHRLIKEAKNRVGKVLLPLATVDWNGPGFTIKCRKCGATKGFSASESYESEHTGASETIPDQTWINIHCSKCGNSVHLWTDWRPKEINTKEEE